LEVAGIAENKQTDALVALDKLDKIRMEGVINELKERGGFSENSLNAFVQFIDLLNKSTNVVGEPVDNSTISTNSRHDSINTASLKNLKEFLGDNESGKVGVLALEKILDLSKTTKAIGRISIFPRLARGLSYYTGAIFEIGLDEGDFTLSLGGGGRYDGLIGMFGKEEIPACGFSLGLERILVVMEERGMFPPELNTSSADVLVTIWNEESMGESLKLATDLRQIGLRVTVYPEADKLGKQFKYASTINAPFVCVLGDSELAEGKVTIKNLASGQQDLVKRGEIKEYFVKS